LPIGPLMIEHRLIEKMIKIIEKEVESWIRESTINIEFVDEAVDFIRVYPDKCHHGKEEDILFRERKKKDISDEYKPYREQLVQEHQKRRKRVAKMVEAKALYLKGNKEMLPIIIRCIEFMTDFYPKHIEKEDKRFFLPCIDYFTQEKYDSILKEGWEYDKNLIHEIYKEKVALWVTSSD